MPRLMHSEQLAFLNEPGMEMRAACVHPADFSQLVVPDIKIGKQFYDAHLSTLAKALGVDM